MQDNTQDQQQPGVTSDPTATVGGAPAAGTPVSTQTDTPATAMPQADPMQVNPETSAPVSETSAVPAAGTPVSTQTDTPAATEPGSEETPGTPPTTPPTPTM